MILSEIVKAKDPKLLKARDRARLCEKTVAIGRDGKYLTKPLPHASDRRTSGTEAGDGRHIAYSYTRVPVLCSSLDETRTESIVSK